MSDRTYTEDEVFDAFMRVLNRAYEADPAAVHALICNRVPCNDELADDPTICVDSNVVAKGGGYFVGLIGMLNGVCTELTGRQVASKEAHRIKLVGNIDEDPSHGPTYWKEMREKARELANSTINEH